MAFVKHTKENKPAMRGIHKQIKINRVLHSKYNGNSRVPLHIHLHVINLLLHRQIKKKYNYAKGRDLERKVKGGAGLETNYGDKGKK